MALVTRRYNAAYFLIVYYFTCFVLNCLVPLNINLCKYLYIFCKYLHDRIHSAIETIPTYITLMFVFGEDCLSQCSRGTAKNTLRWNIFTFHLVRVKTGQWTPVNQFLSIKRRHRVTSFENWKSNPIDWTSLTCEAN